MTSTITFDDLFAFRFQYQDYTMDEYVIIQKLKLILVNNGMSNNDIDDYLFQFYISYGHPITLDEIKSVNISYNNIPSFYNNLQNIINNNTEEEEYDEEDDDEEEIILNDITPNEVQPTHENTIHVEVIPIAANLTNNEVMQIINIMNMLTQPTQLINILNQPLNTSNPFNDIVVTTDDEYLNKLNTIKVKETLVDKCSICMTSIDMGDTMLDIECKHYFHKECLTEYLKKYNHICPVCRKEIGESKVNY